VIQASARWGFHRVTVWSAFGPVSPVLAPPPRHYAAAGSWSGSALAAVAQHRQRGGLVMPYLRDFLQPGIAVENISNVSGGSEASAYPIYSVIQRVTITNERRTQSQHIEFTQ
jgi:hypothetical protein